MNKKNGLFWLILLVIFTPLSFGTLLPFFILFFVLKSLSENKQKEPIKTTKKPRSKPVQSTKRVRFSMEDQKLIDEILTDYFNHNEKLPIIENVFLKTKKGDYTRFDELYILMNNETVSSLDEFCDAYPETGNEIMKMILRFAESKESLNQQNKDIREKPSVFVGSKAKWYMERINQLNIEIENEEITNGLDQTSALLKHIAMIEEKYPDNKDKLNKLYQYYLPILMDILNNYKHLDVSARGHNEFIKSEQRLIKTIILINEAMKNISSSLCEDDFLNLSADMSTLETLLKKDGLVNEGTLEEVRQKVRSTR